MVNVRLPRFRIESSSSQSVVNGLKAIGVKDIFRPRHADLRLMAPTSDLWLSSIEHSASLEVKERSSSSSSNSKAPSSSSNQDVHYFEVDRPFLFLVWDYYSGMLLLMGRVVEPDVIH